MPSAVELLVWTGIASCMCTRYCRFLQNTKAAVHLVKSDLSLDLAVYPRMFFMIWVITKIALFGKSLLLGFMKLKNECHHCDCVVYYWIGRRHNCVCILSCSYHGRRI